jgi:hypothetical protein
VKEFERNICVWGIEIEREPWSVDEETFVFVLERDGERECVV